MRSAVSDSENLPGFRFGKPLCRYDTAFRFGKDQAEPNNFRFGKIDSFRIGNPRYGYKAVFRFGKIRLIFRIGKIATVKNPQSALRSMRINMRISLCSILLLSYCFSNRLNNRKDNRGRHRKRHAFSTKHKR